jgi:hypothetical protein
MMDKKAAYFDALKQQRAYASPVIIRFICVVYTYLNNTLLT